MTAFEVPWQPKDALWIFLLAWIGLPVVIILALQQFGAVSPEVHGFLMGLKNGNIADNFWLLIADSLAALLIIRHYLKRYGASWRDIGLRGFSLFKAVFYLTLVFVSFFVVVAVAYALVKLLLPSFNAGQSQSNEFTNPTSPHAQHLSLIALVIVPPFIEEMVFRGFMFPAFSKRFGVVLGAIFTSLLFGIAHLQANVTVYTLVLSLLLCALYYKLRSIWPGIFFHMLNNYLAFAALMHK